MDWFLVKDIAVAVLLILGCFMSLAAGIGLLRFPDVLSRMHAATKPQVLGLLCLLLAVALNTGQWMWVPLLVLIWVFQLLTAPVSAHMVGRAAYRSKHLKSGLLVQDDLADIVKAAEAARAAEGFAERQHGVQDK
ncbi:monovalent cation/H(+) antiporter subunit G [Galactobacter caseinivorans]|uniref:Monovalent cation/H(+) antiporter subunit G n=1 Tax=Galactobacter caseinivorans TaxID=2676123 RepID=A0A496PIC6_9MICC|nr:monovalent cation/H(+) antiporter subunit G [Galactobacter caseinivorans]RKW70244.1 monovalent cation/H(+) antiporter subunit G [Galactobacter caseinivorans]